MDMQMESQKPVLFTPRVSKIAAILLRILTTIFLFLSLFILIAKVNITLVRDGDKKKISRHSYDLVGYRYMLVTIIMGSAYSIWQILRTAINVRKGYQGNLNLDYYGDKVMSIALSTGSVAGYITTGEQQSHIHGGGSRRYFRTGYAADGFVFLGFICVLVLSELSTYARIPKRF